MHSYVLAKGKEWFDSYPEESMVVAKNLRALDIPPHQALVKRIQAHILLHYYEKLLPLCLSPEELHRYLLDRVSVPPELENLKEALARKKGVLLATCHFGAVECIGPALAALGIPFTGVLRFSAGHASDAARSRAADLTATGLFAQINFVEIGNPRTVAALDMAAVLRRGGILLAVFDERTPYSVPVSLCGKQVWGGAGLHRIVRLAQDQTSVWTAFSVRSDGETYGLRLHELNGDDPAPVQSMYNDFESLLAHYMVQWYFLHEEIPFVT